MIEIIIYCVFCYLVELGIQMTKDKYAKKISWGSYLLAPIMFPLELGKILGENFIE